MYVGNLPAWATDTDLVDVMSGYGPISKAWVIPGEGYGFVSFQDPGIGADLLQNPPPYPPRLTDRELVLSSAFRAKHALQVRPQRQPPTDVRCCCCKQALKAVEICQILSICCSAFSPLLRRLQSYAPDSKD